MSNSQYSTFTAQAREEKGRTTFLIDANLIESVAQLPAEQAVSFFRSLSDYVLHDTQPDKTNVIGIMAQQSIVQMEFEAKHYMEVCARNKKNVEKRWEKTEKSQGTPTTQKVYDDSEEYENLPFE